MPSQREEEFLEALADIVDEEPEDIVAGGSLRDDFGVDSIRGVAIAVLVERQFEVRLTEDDFGEVDTYQQLVELLNARGAAL